MPRNFGLPKVTGGIAPGAQQRPRPHIGADTRANNVIQLPTALPPDAGRLNSAGRLTAASPLFIPARPVLESRKVGESSLDERETAASFLFIAFLSLVGGLLILAYCGAQLLIA